jgi:hypothetical protein
MTERDQLRQVCEWNRTIAHENARLRDELHREHHACRELGSANANLRVELDACDGLLGAAMDRLLDASERP